MRPDWRARLQQPLTLSLLLHGGLAALLFAFSHHLRPELPEPAAPLQARLYGALPATARPPVMPAQKPEPAPVPVKPAPPEKPAPLPKPADKPKPAPTPKVEKSRPEKPAPVKSQPEKPAPVKPSKPEKPASKAKEPVLPKSRSSEHKQAEKPPAKTSDKKPAKDKPEAVRAPDKTPPKERPAPEQPSSAVKHPDKASEKTRDNAKEKPKDKPRADDKPKAQDKTVPESKPVRKPEPPKKLQAVSELDELEREMQSVQGQLKAQQERERLKKAADAAARAEAERLAGEQRAEAQRLAQLQKARDSSALIGKYTQLIRGKITKVWDIPLNISKNSRAVLSISLLPGGEVANVVVVQSSGDKAFDESIKAAVYRASPLPVPEDPATFGQTFKNFRIEFMKED